MQRPPERGCDEGLFPSRDRKLRFTYCFENVQADSIRIGNGQIRFTLPSFRSGRDPSYCLFVNSSYLRAHLSNPGTTDEASQRRAENIAWFRMWRWLEATIRLIHSHVVSAHEVFFPYLLTNDEKQITMHTAFLQSLSRARVKAAAGGAR